MRDRRIAIYVRPDLKIKMQEFKINWSAVAQRAFMDEIDRMTPKMKELQRNLAILGEP